MKKALALAATHLIVLAIGFAAGVYTLPLLTAPKTTAALPTEGVIYEGRFRRDLKDSDFLHWGEGRVLLTAQSVAFEGELAPGPDYKLYLSPRFVETEADFRALKASMLRVGDVKGFKRFVLPLPDGADLTRYDTVVVWCESFDQFITAATFR